MADSESDIKLATQSTLQALAVSGPFPSITKIHSLGEAAALS